MSLINQAIDLLSHNISSSNVDSSNIGNALLELLPTKDGDIDFMQLISQFTQGNFSELLNSFLGDGTNMTMVASQIVSIFGQENITNFASKIGIAPETATDILSNIIPQLIDKNSQGGSPLQLAGKFLNNLFG
jgi:uncharacterized protein YidB (DUF937 family)